MSESSNGTTETATNLDRLPTKPAGGRPAHLETRWLLAAAVLLVALIVLAFVTAPPNRGLLRLAGIASPVSLALTRDPTPISLGRYLRTHRGLDLLFVDDRTAEKPGHVVSYTVTYLDPDLDHLCRLHWTQLDRDRDQPAEESFWRYENVLGWPDGLLSPPDATPGGVAGELWVPLPNQFLDVGWFFIQVRLRCAGGDVVTGGTDHFRVDLPSRAPTPVPRPRP